MSAPTTPSGGEAPLVTIRDLVKRYRQGRGGSRAHEVVAVDGVSLEIRAGETFALVGESGSGKSTVAKMLLRLEPPTSGTIEFEGRDVWALDRAGLKTLRRRLAIVFQNPVASLNRRRTVEEIIAAPLEIHRMGDRGARRRRVHELLELVGLDTVHARRLPSALSGGQCQRVGIARALALEPRLVILDEAVSAVDVSIRAQILNLLRDLQELTGVAYLFISHDLAVVHSIAPRLAVMQHGRIVEAGTRTEVFGRPQHEYTRALLAAVPEPDPANPFPLRRTKESA